MHADNAAAVLYSEHNTTLHQSPVLDLSYLTWKC